MTDKDPGQLDTWKRNQRDKEIKHSVDYDE